MNKETNFVLKCSSVAKRASTYASPLNYRNYIVNETIPSPNDIDSIASSQEMSLTRLAPKEQESIYRKTPTNRDLLTVEKVLLRDSSLCRQVLKQFSQVKSTSTRTTYNSEMETTRANIQHRLSEIQKHNEKNKENIGSNMKKKVLKDVNCQDKIGITQKTTNAKKQLFNQKKIDPNTAASKRTQGNRKENNFAGQETFLSAIACTRVSNEQYRFLKDTIAVLGQFSLDKCVTKRTSHLIAGESERTINMLRGIARGLWVVNFDWVKRSFEAQKWLHEDEFEVNDFSIAVSKCRIERQTFGAPFKVRLFDDVGNIYVCKNCTPKRKFLEELIVLCDGKIVRSIEDAVIIIGDEFLGRYQNAFHLKETWILDSITKKKVQVTKKYRFQNID